MFMKYTYMTQIAMNGREAFVGVLVVKAGK